MNDLIQTVTILLFGRCVFRILDFRREGSMPRQHPAGSLKALNAAEIHRMAKSL